jgi:hypothetical protein
VIALSRFSTETVDQKETLEVPQLLKISRALEKGLDFLGQSAKCSTLWYLKRDFGLTPDNFARRTDDLTHALEKMFGQGSYVIEKRLTDVICADFKISPFEGTSLKKALEIAKKLAR